MAAALILSSPVLLAQPESFDERTSVVLVEVPVQVLVKGRPVAGLTVDDFAVFDRGKRQQIIGFEAFDFRAPAVPEPAGDAAAGPGELAAPKRNLLFLFDFAYPAAYDPVWGAGYITASVHGLYENSKRFREVVDAHLGARDRWAIALFSPLRGMRLLQGWTTDPADVHDSLDLLDAVILGDAKQVRSRFESRQQGSASSPEVADLMVSLDDLLGESLTRAARGDPNLPHRSITDEFVDGMIEVSRALDGVAGSKSVVYMSVGFVNASLKKLRQLYAEYRKSNWTIQSVSTGSNGYYADSLRMVAQETGGQAYFYSNDLDLLLEEMLDQTAVSYVLAFQPPNLEANGAYHRLKVKLLDAPRGARVVHRRGYYAPGADFE